MARKESLSLKFNGSIYRAAAIQKTMRVYSGFADFSMKKQKGYFVVMIKNISPEVRPILSDEFSNYCLGAA